jgi:hypothetical protein
MTTIRFQINEETAYKQIATEEWEAMERAQDGDVKIYRLRPVLARFMVDEEGKPLTQEQALKISGKMPFDEFMGDVFPAFFEALRSAAVPKANGNSSNQLSPASTPASEFPIGSTS